MTVNDNEAHQVHEAIRKAGNPPRNRIASSRGRAAQSPLVKAEREAKAKTEQARLAAWDKLAPLVLTDIRDQPAIDAAAKDYLVAAYADAEAGDALEAAVDTNLTAMVEGAEASQLEKRSEALHYLLAAESALEEDAAASGVIACLRDGNEVKRWSPGHHRAKMVGGNTLRTLIQAMEREAAPAPTLVSSREYRKLQAGVEAVDIQGEPVAEGATVRVSHPPLQARPQ